MAKDYRRMVLAIKDATGMSLKNLSLELGKPGNYLSRYLGSPGSQLKMSVAEQIDALYRKHCNGKPVNVWASMVITIKSRSDLNDMQIAERVGVTLGWMSQCMTNTNFDPRVSEAGKLRAIYQEWMGLEGV